MIVRIGQVAVVVLGKIGMSRVVSSNQVAGPLSQFASVPCRVSGQVLRNACPDQIRH